MPRPRFQRLSAQRREQILETSAREFAEHGFAGASLNHILEEAGLSKGAAYYYFDDKADLFSTVVQHYFFDHLARDAQLDVERLDRETFWPKVFELYRQGAVHMREFPWMAGLARALWKLPRDVRAAGSLAPLFEFGIGWLKRLLGRGQEVGVVRTDLPSDLLVALMVAIDGATDQWLSEHLDSLAPDELEVLTARLLRGLRTFLEPEVAP
jgi:AcrR family transcriptional regulator